MNNLQPLIEAIKAAAPKAPDYCLFWKWDWEVTCMPRGEWASWVQAIGACVALLVAIRAPHWFAARERRRIRRGHFAVIALDVRTARVLAQRYSDGTVRSPAYRVPLHGLTVALPALVGDETLSYDEGIALSDFYLEAASFNDCLDLTAQMKKDGDDWKGEVSRNMNLAGHLIAGTDSRRPTRYDDARQVLRAHSMLGPHWWLLRRWYGLKESARRSL